MEIERWESVTFQEFSWWIILDIDNKENQIFPEFLNDYMVEFMKDEKTLDILVIKGEDIEKININL